MFDGYWKQSFDLYVANLDEPVKEPRRSRSRSSPRDAEGPAALRAGHPGDPRPRQRQQVQRAQVLPRGRPDLHRGQQRPELPRPDRLLLLRLPGQPPDPRRPQLDRHSLSNFDITLHRPLPPLVLAGRDLRYPELLLHGRSAAQPGPAGAHHLPGDRGGRVLVYPFSFYHRAELGVGYIYRKNALPVGDPLNSRASSSSPTASRSSRGPAWAIRRSSPTTARSPAGAGGWAPPTPPRAARCSIPSTSTSGSTSR